MKKTWFTKLSLTVMGFVLASLSSWAQNTTYTTHQYHMSAQTLEEINARVQRCLNRNSRSQKISCLIDLMNQEAQISLANSRTLTRNLHPVLRQAIGNNCAEVPENIIEIAFCNRQSIQTLKSQVELYQILRATNRSAVLMEELREDNHFLGVIISQECRQSSSRTTNDRCFDEISAGLLRQIRDALNASNRHTTAMTKFSVIFYQCIQNFSLSSCGHPSGNWNTQLVANTDNLNYSPARPLRAATTSTNNGNSNSSSNSSSQSTQEPRANQGNQNNNNRNNNGAGNTGDGNGGGGQNSEVITTPSTSGNNTTQNTDAQNTDIIQDEAPQVVLDPRDNSGASNQDGTPSQQEPQQAPQDEQEDEPMVPVTGTIEDDVTTTNGAQEIPEPVNSNQNSDETPAQQPDQQNSELTDQQIAEQERQERLEEEQRQMAQHQQQADELRPMFDVDPFGATMTLNSSDFCSPEMQRAARSAIAINSRTMGVGKSGETIIYACEVQRNYSQNKAAVFLVEAALRMSNITSRPTSEVIGQNYIPQWFDWAITELKMMQNNSNAYARQELEALVTHLESIMVDFHEGRTSSMRLATQMQQRNRPSSIIAQPFCQWSGKVNEEDLGSTRNFPRSLIDCRLFGQFR